ncbi:MAG TPA: DUF3515 domain-containing protein [Actinophytocola sp.]|uniref:DUF3515 domain-containing protein n=1 Tax=Actinophytocola sp. TaxID=1872138 RepID=UPI002DDD0A76|nr:DUF3515 domain-containing protein [Actinophytocola sp.]HEV2779623.1 DUF3515 domain-containing protein [Actinophytocola sp.]
MSDRSSPEPLSRRTIGVAVGLALALAVGVIVISRLVGDAPVPAPPPTTTTSAPRTGPLALVPVDAPDANSPACAALLGRLPARLSSGSRTLGRLPLAEPAPPATVAWGDGGEPVVLRCGLPRPPELTPTAQLRDISGVSWLPVQGDGATTWYVVDRTAYVALTVPGDAGTGPLQEISETVRGKLQRRPG